MKNIALATVMSVALGSVPAALGDAAQDAHSTGGRNVPVHRFGLRDDNDETIVPTIKRAMPFSARFTCGNCHDYKKIEGGWHFNAMKFAPSGRAGEPWVWVDDLTGTRLPVSYRGWRGTFKPGEIGISPWRFTQLFGRHMPGGGIYVPLDEEAMADVKGVREVLGKGKDPWDRKIKPNKWQWRFKGLDSFYSAAALAVDPNARWDVSGKPEINCLGCHSASPMYDQSEWAKQMARENFRWAATAASGLGEVGGTASLQPNTWTVPDGPSPDDTGYATPPAVTYDLGRFNAKHWAFVNVSRPRDQRCLYCHSVTEAAKERWRVAGDVHSASGLACAKCHRNDLGHNISRGYPDEAADRGTPAVGELSCESCHLGTGGDAPMGGRFGAPYPKHEGFPPAHFDKLACTTCHSGPWPKQTPTRVWTSRANRMGIAGIAQWRTDAPYIAEPVFMKGADGKIAPHRMMWPAFWGRLEGEKVTPLLPDDLLDAARGILDAEQQVGNVLLMLGEPLADAEAEVMPEVARKQQIGGTAVMIVAGKLFRRNLDGGVDVSDYVGQTPAGVWWARERDGQVLPLIRDYNPAYLGMSTDLDERILVMLRALAAGNPGAGEPVLDCGDKVYRREITKVVKKETDSKTKEVKTTITYPFLIKEVKDLKRPAARARAPAFAWLRDGQVRPLVPEFAVDAVVQTAGIAESFTERQVAMMLAKLTQTRGGKYVYVSAGRAFSLGGDGGLVAGENPAAEPCAWPIAHDVRPAAQSLGTGAIYGCQDCHSDGSPFLFGRVTGAGPLKTAERMSRAMHEFEDLDVNFQRLFGFTFVFRTLFKTMLFAVACVVGAVLLAYALPAVRRLVRSAGTRE